MSRRCVRLLRSPTRAHPHGGDFNRAGAASDPWRVGSELAWRASTSLAIGRSAQEREVLTVEFFGAAPRKSPAAARHMVNLLHRRLSGC